MNLKSFCRFCKLIMLIRFGSWNKWERIYTHDQFKRQSTDKEQVTSLWRWRLQHFSMEEDLDCSSDMRNSSLARHFLNNNFKYVWICVHALSIVTFKLFCFVLCYFWFQFNIYFATCTIVTLLTYKIIFKARYIWHKLHVHTYKYHTLTCLC